MNITLSYYQQNAESFIENTVNVDFHETADHFLSFLQQDTYILDFGCGAGRDTKYFIEHGYQVDAIDGSDELCRYACEYTGIAVKKMLFQELEEREKYDGIWACASILHIAKDDLPDVIRRMCIALKENGTIYTSFKYGEFEGVRNGRYFSDYTEESFAKMLVGIPELQIEEQWISTDARPDRGEEKWLNIIMRKTVIS